jgi:hypothetical protein
MKKIAYDGLTAYFILKVSIQHEKHPHLGIWSHSQIVAVFSRFILLLYTNNFLSGVFSVFVAVHYIQT